MKYRTSPDAQQAIHKKQKGRQKTKNNTISFKRLRPKREMVRNQRTKKKIQPNTVPQQQGSRRTHTTQKKGT